MANADINWLLSSTAQSSAALVAIIGGLQGARYVSLHAEQQAARRRRDDLARRASAAAARLAEQQLRLDRYGVDNVLLTDDIFELVVKNDFEVTVDDALSVSDGDDTGLPAALLRERLGQLCASLRAARDRLVELVPESEEHPSWDMFRRANEVLPDEDGAWRWMYQKVVEARTDEARKRRREAERRRDPFGSSMSDLVRSSSLTRLTSPEAYAIRSLRAQSMDQAHEARLIDYRDDAQRINEQLRDELQAADAHLADVEQPEGFRLALQVLAVLTAVGVVMPTAIMATGAQKLAPLVRVAVAGAFFAGVALLLRYLFVYAAYLSDRHKRQHLPENILRLVFGREPVPSSPRPSPDDVAPR